MRLIQKCFLVALAVMLPLLSGQAQTEQKLDRIVAVVDDSVITERELGQKTDLILLQLRQQGAALPPRDEIETQVLERMILDEIQLQMAQRMGVRISDLRLNEAITDIAQQNGFTLEGFRQQLAREGLDYTQFRDNFRNEMIIANLQQRQLMASVRVTDQEIDNFLKSSSGQAELDYEYLVGHILVSLPAAPSPEETQAAQRIADDLVQAINEGTDFQQLAVSRSAGQEALEGGDLGWRSAAELPTIFVEEVLVMDVDEVAGPIRSASGFHIIRLLDRRGGAVAVQQTSARHILIKPSAITSDDDAQQRLLKITEDIERGNTDFATQAQRFSEDPGSAAQGGDLGWISPGMMVPEFEEVMNTLAAGETSAPFKTEFGWHIVEVVERREVDQGQEIITNRVRQLIQRRKYEEELQSWLRQIRDAAYVDIRLNNNPDIVSN